jgi:hypothetical protein
MGRRASPLTHSRNQTSRVRAPTKPTPYAKVCKSSDSLSPLPRNRGVHEQRQERRCDLDEQEAREGEAERLAATERTAPVEQQREKDDAIDRNGDSRHCIELRPGNEVGVDD